MPRRIGPPRPRYEFGPECGANAAGREPCRYRPICTGYAPIESPTVSLSDRDGTVEERGVPESDFLFILEALGPDEVALGRNAVGPTGGIFDKLLREQTPLRRRDITLANPVRCRPIVHEAHSDCGGLGCSKCDSGQIPSLLDYNGDHITTKPSPDQVRECASRYMDRILDEGKFKYIIALGGTAAHYMLGRQIQVNKMRGTIFEPGEDRACDLCRGEKTLPGKPKKCPACKGRGHGKCECGGATKHRKKCEIGAFPTCANCAGLGTSPGKRKRCYSCEGAGVVPVDPDKPHVCRKLKPGQLMMITYHPAYLTRNPGMWPVVERDFQRITKMEEELEYASTARYDEYPPVGSDGLYAEICGRVDEVLSGCARDDLWDGAPPPLIFDLETTGLDAEDGRITHFAFTDRPGYGCVLRPDDERVPGLLRSPVLVGANHVLFDCWWLHRHGREIPKTTQLVDIRFLGKVANPDTPNDLFYLSSEFADPPMRGYWKARADYRRDKGRVACLDVDATARAEVGLWNHLTKTGQAEFVRSYIIPISRVVFEIRQAGMRINRDRMEEAVSKVQSYLDERRLELPDWGGARSEGQHAKVQEHLYKTLRLPVRKKRGTWKVTADRDARMELLGYLGSNHKIVAHLNDEEKESAIAFVELLDDLWDTSLLKREFKQLRFRPDSFVHPELNPVHTATLRPGAVRPAVLKVPSCKCKPACHGTEKHKCGSGCPGTAAPKCKNARWVFIPDEPDWEIMSVDLSQAEVIGFLWYAEQWDVLDQILNRGMDAYQTIANKILGREANAAERDRTKVDTLAFIYGEGERTQSLRLRIPVEEIRTRRAVYVTALPGVQDFRDELVRSAMQRGFVESPWGVRRYIRVDSPRGRAANEACNAPIQNICPMITGHAMIKLHAQLPKPARLWPPWVYDEINLVYPREQRRLVYEAVRDILGAPVPQMPASPLKMGSGLRFRLDFAVGRDWGHLEKLNEAQVG